jgi:hypothetical protein
MTAMINIRGNSGEAMRLPSVCDHHRFADRTGMILTEKVARIFKR